MIWLAWLACTGPQPAAWQLGRTEQGPAGIGYGHSVAWVGESLAVGAPVDASGGHVFIDGALVLTGEGSDFLGSALVGGEALIVASPRHGGGRGALLDRDGQTLWAGDEAVGLGSRPVRHREGLAALRVGGVVSQAGDGWSESGRLWSLASVDLGAGAQLVAGRVDGRLSVSGLALGPADAASELGYSLSPCTIGGETMLAVGVPGRDEVRLLGSVDEAGMADAIVIRGHARTRFGHAVLCQDGQLWVGAPSGAGAVFHVPDPLSGELGWSWTAPGPHEQAGFALDRSPSGILAAGAPGSNRVYRFRPVP